MGTTLRVAGGWVRDKLVGQEQGFHQRHLSKVDKMDIDIALDNCMGGDFAEKLKRYLARVREFFFFSLSRLLCCGLSCIPGSVVFGLGWLLPAPRLWVGWARCGKYGLAMQLMHRMSYNVVNARGLIARPPRLLVLIKYELDQGRPESSSLWFSTFVIHGNVKA